MLTRSPPEQFSQRLAISAAIALTGSVTSARWIAPRWRDRPTLVSSDARRGERMG